MTKKYCKEIDLNNRRRRATLYSKYFVPFSGYNKVWYNYSRFKMSLTVKKNISRFIIDTPLNVWYVNTVLRRQDCTLVGVCYAFVFLCHHKIMFEINVFVR